MPNSSNVDGRPANMSHDQADHAATSVTHANLDAVDNIVNADRSLSIQQNANTLGIVMV